jgi:signal transduction histidine kinase
MPAVARTVGRLRRQYVLVTGLFAVSLVASFALFAHLMSQQLSRSYLEDVLLSGRAQAEDLARQIGGGAPVYRVIETRREALAKISAALSRQEVVESMRVFDERGRMVWRTTSITEGVTGGFPEGNVELIVPSTSPRVVETSNSYEIRVPLEQVGTVVMDLSKTVLATRISLLRRQLLTHVAVVGGLSLSMMLGAVAFIWHLVQRNAELAERRRRDDELAALGSLAANLAHEIRNPLNALSINLELLEEDLRAAAGDEATLGMAQREVGRLSSLVNDFLVYARPTPLRLEEFTLGEMLRDVAEVLAPPCSRAAVEMAVHAGAVKLRADRAQLGQVLMNLGLNAVQAMEDGPRRRLELRGAADGDFVVVEVVDSGPGIPAEELARVREAFYTRRKGGTGLGLAIAERIVNAHGGSLTLSNRREGGLRAVVRVPQNPSTTV